MQGCQLLSLAEVLLISSKTFFKLYSHRVRIQSRKYIKIKSDSNFKS